MKRLKGKVAMVTSGLGAAAATRMAEEGATVVVTDINFEAVKSHAATIPGAIALEQGVTDEARWKEIVDQILANCGQLNVLVNNAGMAAPATVEAETLEG